MTDGHDTLSPARVRAEEMRVREAYARRLGLEERYSYGNPAYVFMMQERERAALALLARTGVLPLDARRILEVGCGGGQWLRDLVRWGASPHRLSGLDLLLDRVRQARATSPAAVTLLRGAGTALPYRDATFDLVLQATVFSSLLDGDVRRTVANELLRVLRPRGAVLWYDFRVNNPQNHDVRRVGRAEIAELFPGCQLRLARVTLAPPLTRLLARRLRPVAEALSAVPWLRTHYLGVVRKP